MSAYGKLFLLALIDAAEALSLDVMADRSDEALRKFLEFGSATPDNSSAAAAVEYGEYQPQSLRRRVSGLKLRESAVGLADIAFAVENSDEVVEVVKNCFPSLSEEEVFAALRVMSMVIFAFNSDAVVGGLTARQ